MRDEMQAEMPSEMPRCGLFAPHRAAHYEPIRTALCAVSRVYAASAFQHSLFVQPSSYRPSLPGAPRELMRFRLYLAL